MNERELNAILAKNGKNRSDLAALLGLNLSTISRKIKGSTEFKANEIKLIKLAYNLSPDEIERIFFSK